MPSEPPRPPSTTFTSGHACGFEDRFMPRAANPAGVPVWSVGGIICTGETYKAYVKLTFARGAALPDPSHLFNAGLDGKMRRAIDIREGDALDDKAFTSLVRAAAALNTSAANR